MNRDDFQRLAQVRIEEAEALLASGHFAGAYYLAGYSIECAIKAYVAKQTKQYDFPDKDLVLKVYKHSPKDLVGGAGLDSELELEIKADNTSAGYWGVVSKWSERYRYNLNKDEKDARELYTAITDQAHGVLQWLKKRW